MTAGYRAAFMVAALIMVAGLVTTVVAVRSKPQATAAETAIEAA